MTTPFALFSNTAIIHLFYNKPTKTILTILVKRLLGKGDAPGITWVKRQAIAGRL